MINKRLLNTVPECLSYIKKNVFLQWIAMLSNIVITAILVYLIANIYEQKDISFLGYLLIAIIFLGIRIFANQKAVKMSYYSSKLVKNTLRKRLYEKLAKIGTSYTNTWSTAEIVQLSSEGVEQLETYFAMYIPQFFYALLAPLTLFFIVCWIDFKAAIALLICVPLIPVSIIFVQKFAKKLLNKYWGQYTQLGDSFLENLQGLTTLKIYEADENQHKKMNQEAENFRKITMKVLTMQLNSITIMDLIAYAGSAIGIVFSIIAFRANTITLYQALFIILISSEFFIPMRLLGSYFHIAMNGMAAADKMFAIFDYPIDTTKTNKISSSHPSIKASHLNFSYNEDKQILKDINFEFSKGFVAFVGESGSGKSTIANLITGRLDNYQGSLMIDTNEIAKTDPDSLFSKITLLSHESYLFAGTVKENLLMANDKATDNELIKACQLAGIKEFLDSEQGLDTPIKEQGNNLSGGQRQRIAFARAILKDTDILLLDEATSNIDVDSENYMMKKVYELSKEKLVICISHRLANIIKADKIYVLNNGQIVETGQHKELLEANQVYAKLWNTQKELEKYGGYDNEDKK